MTVSQIPFAPNTNSSTGQAQQTPSTLSKSDAVTAAATASFSALAVVLAQEAAAAKNRSIDGSDLFNC